MKAFTLRLGAAVAAIALSIAGFGIAGGNLAHAAGLYAAAGQESPRWFAAWGSSPAFGMPEASVPTRGFEGKTIRLVVHSTLGGDQVRIRVSNAYGDQPLLVQRATVARSSDDLGRLGGISSPAVDLAFSGKQSIVIQPGGIALSDPIGYNLPSRTNLAVSLYLPTFHGLATAHEYGYQSSYIVAGDQTTSKFITPLATTNTRFFLTGVDVRSSTGRGTIVAFGDSITNGYLQWPDQLARRLDENNLPYAVANAGISGNGYVVETRPAFGAHGSERFDRDVLSLPNVTHVISLLGINDFGQPGFYGGNTVSADEVITGISQLASRAHEHGIKFYAATLGPFEGSIFYTPQGEQSRRTVNDWIRTTKVIDGFVDFETALADPASPTRLRPAYDTGDHLHPSRAGYEAMGAIVDLDIFR